MQCHMTCRRNVATRALGAGIIAKKSGARFYEKTHYLKTKKNQIS